MTSSDSLAPRAGSPARKSSRSPLKIADRYLLTSVVEATLRGLLWFGGLLVMAALITAVRKVMENGIGISGMLQLMIYQVPRIFLFALPMSMLYGTVQAFTELSTESEITALAAGGMSLPRMMVPGVIWGLILAITGFVLQETVVPVAQMRMDKVTLAGAVSTLGKKLQWVDPPPGKGPIKKVVQADRLDAATGTLINPRVQIYNESGMVKIQIQAARGQWDLATNRWKFIDGVTTFYGPGRAGAWVDKSSSKFDSIENNHAPALGKLTRANVSTRAAMDKDNYEYVSIWDVWRYREEMRDDKARATSDDDRNLASRRVKSATFGIHDKIATPLVVLALVLVGAPLGLRPPRAKGQSGVAMGVSLAVLIVYYVTWTACTAIGKNGFGNPVLFAYLSPLLTFAAGIVLTYKKAH